MRAAGNRANAKMPKLLGVPMLTRNPLGQREKVSAHARLSELANLPRPEFDLAPKACPASSIQSSSRIFAPSSQTRSWLLGCRPTRRISARRRYALRAFHASTASPAAYPMSA